MRRQRILSLATPLVALALVLTACGDSDSGEAGASTAHNDQDVAFATDMIPHHAQAVEMADLAADRADSQEVKDLAQDISAAQGPEIEQLSSWLDAWGEEVPEARSGDREGMDHGDMGVTEDMPGMMSSQEMDELTTASGTEFDQLFLTLMIAHHQGAIQMAQT